MSKSDNIYNALDFARNKLKSATEAKGAAVASPYSLMDIAAAVQTIENGLEVGVLVSAGTGLKVQPLGFEGTSATANGAAESYAAKIFNTGKDEPAYASSGDTSAFESDAMAIIGTPTGGGGGGESGGGSLSYPEGYYLTMNAEAISLTYNFTQTDATATGLNRVWETNDGIYRLKAEPYGDENKYYWGIYTIQNNTQIYATNQSGNINPWALLGWHSETGGVSIAVTWTVSEAVA